MQRGRALALTILFVMLVAVPALAHHSFTNFWHMDRTVETLEDPLFLTRPFTWSHTWRKTTTRPLDGWAECDPDVTRREIELTVKEKYPEK
jgi:hypothetical protein